MKNTINEALKHIADMPGCMTYIEHQELTIAGEEMAVGHVWQTALKTYTTTLNERVSKPSIKSREELRKWSDDYILGFFEGLTAGVILRDATGSIKVVDACDLH